MLVVRNQANEEKETLVKLNNVIGMIFFTPLAIAYFTLFFIFNLLLIPVGYLTGVIRLVTSNPFQNDTYKSSSRKCDWLVFGLVGLPLLLVTALFVDSFYFVVTLYNPEFRMERRELSFMSMDEIVTRQTSVINVSNFMTLYSVLTRKVTSNSASKTSTSHQPMSKQVMVELRK